MSDSSEVPAPRDISQPPVINKNRQSQTSFFSSLLSSRIMQFSILALVAALAMTAFADVASILPQTVSLSLPDVHHIGHEHVTDFRQPCDCPPAECHPELNAKSLCECQAAAQLACYKKSLGGCPEPVPAVC
ncbi:hypothetical protein AMS68_006007 [Peltaster fructicola]|uniref:Uncharacterized protein n=1 Tax=Peltaster fructicola TaxID=286661 RepID=A0A6H0Y1F6_9PEZI|nr:hypothetical protein AMS68_006007 [Peltaster fructicola]